MATTHDTSFDIIEEFTSICVAFTGLELILRNCKEPTIHQYTTPILFLLVGRLSHLNDHYLEQMSEEATRREMDIKIKH